MTTTTLLPLRFQLKNGTAAAHVALERRIGPLHHPNAYNEYVRGLHRFRAAAERWLARFGLAHFQDWRAQNIEPHLHHDMRDLGLAPLPPQKLGWRTSGVSFALGVHYVLEGSALGARVLCKQVEALGLHREHGARHLWAQAEAPGNWRAFLVCLGAHEANIDEAAAIAGANAAFQAAAASMDDAAHE